MHSRCCTHLQDRTGASQPPYGSENTPSHKETRRKVPLPTETLFRRDPCPTARRKIRCRFRENSHAAAAKETAGVGSACAGEIPDEGAPAIELKYCSLQSAVHRNGPVIHHRIGLSPRATKYSGNRPVPCLCQTILVYIVPMGSN